MKNDSKCSQCGKDLPEGRYGHCSEACKITEENDEITLEFCIPRPAQKISRDEWI